MTYAHFSADWLQQREPFDAAARALAAPRLRLPPWLAAQRRSPVRVVDLACGTGANFRVLAPQLGHGQQWLVVDHDEALLACWPSALREWSRRQGGSVEASGASLHVRGPGFDAAIVRQRVDLAIDLASLPFHAATLVTASALLDLVSEAWLMRLIDLCAAARTAMLFALSVEGVPRWRPVDPQDGLAAALFDAHQARDKGFGPALGPTAGAVASRLSRAAGYTLRRARSDWMLDEGAEATELQRALIGGIAAAAIEQQPASAASLRAWQARRETMAARATLRVAHVDLLALPGRRSESSSRSHSTSSPIT